MRAIASSSSRDTTGVDWTQANLSTELAPHAGEVQPWRRRVFRSTLVGERYAVRAQHTQMANERLQAAPVSGRADYRVWLQATPVDKNHLAAFESLHLSHDARLSLLKCGDEPVVDGWIAQMPTIVGVDTLACARQPVPSEVTERQPLDDLGGAVGKLARQVIDYQDQERLSWDAKKFA